MLLMNRREKKITDIPLIQIRPCRTQARQSYNSERIKELAASIDENGILQPLTVRRISSAEYELIAGERRLRAAAMCGISKVPCIIITCSDKEAEVYSLVENMQRADMNFIEEAQGINRLLSSESMTRQEAARALGKKQQTLSEKLKLLDFSDEEKTLILKAHLTERHASALLKIGDKTERLLALGEIIEYHMNVSQCEQYVEELLSSTKMQRRQNQKCKASIKDKRILENTLNNAVDSIRSFGINAETAQCENEYYVEYIIRIPR